MRNLFLCALLLAAATTARASEPEYIHRPPPAIPATSVSQPVFLDNGLLWKDKFGNIAVRDGRDSPQYFFKWRDAPPYCLLARVDTGAVIAELRAISHPVGKDADGNPAVHSSCPEIVHE